MKIRGWSNHVTGKSGKADWRRPDEVSAHAPRVDPLRAIRRHFPRSARASLKTASAPSALLLASLISGCGAASVSPPSNGSATSPPQARAHPGQRDSMPEQLRRDAALASRHLDPPALDALTRSPSVMESFRYQRLQIAIALKCSPGARAMGERAGGPAPQIALLGLDPATIDCAAGEGAGLDPVPPGLRTAPSRYQLNEGRPPGYLGAVMNTGSVFATVFPAMCEGSRVPDRAVAPIRRRWRGEIRLLAPQDAVVRRQIVDLLADPRLQAALGDVTVRLVEDNPNAIIPAGHAFVQTATPSRPMEGAGTATCRGDGRRYRSYNQLAGRLTGGRRTYLAHGSDFTAANAESGVQGFTLSDPAGTIEGAACLPPFQDARGLFPNTRRALATDCLARMLGLGGPARLTSPRLPWDVRFTFVTMDRQGAIKLSPVALDALRRLYSH